MSSPVEKAMELLRGTGFTVVPIKPTKEMVMAGETAIENSMDSTKDSYGTHLIEEPRLWAAAAYRAMVDVSAAMDDAVRSGGKLVEYGILTPRKQDIT
jgi:hypothetical protein